MHSWLGQRPHHLAGLPRCAASFCVGWGRQACAAGQTSTPSPRGLVLSRRGSVGLHSWPGQRPPSSRGLHPAMLSVRGGGRHAQLARPAALPSRGFPPLRRRVSCWMGAAGLHSWPGQRPPSPRGFPPAVLSVRVRRWACTAGQASARRHRAGFTSQR